MPQPIFALIFPLSGDGGLTPGYPLPTPPVYPGHGLPGAGYPDQGLPGGRPEHPWYPAHGGGGRPTPPIVIPPEAAGPGLPSQPIYLPGGPDNSLPGGSGGHPWPIGGRPDRPSHELPGMGGHPWLPGYGNRP